jgi:pyruvate dehydrogenase E1 component beta subunit
VPLDEAIIIESVKKTGRLVVVEEGWYFSGVGATIASTIMYKAFDYFDAPVEVVSGASTPMPYAENLEKLAIPSIDKIVKSAEKACYTKNI